MRLRQGPSSVGGVRGMPSPTRDACHATSADGGAAPLDLRRPARGAGGPDEGLGSQGRRWGTALRGACCHVGARGDHRALNMHPPRRNSLGLQSSVWPTNSPRKPTWLVPPSPFMYRKGNRGHEKGASRVRWHQELGPVPH